MLGKQPHNNKSIEVQVMRRFQRDSKMNHIQLPTEFQSDFSPISIQEAIEKECEDIKKVSTIHFKQMISELDSVEWSIDFNYFKIPTNSSRCILTADEQHYLKGVYSLMYPNEIISSINVTV